MQHNHAGMLFQSINMQHIKVNMCLINWNMQHEKVPCKHDYIIYMST